MSTTGPDLRFLRRSREVSQAALAQGYGCVRQRITQIESQRTVRPSTARRYLDALRAAEATPDTPPAHGAASEAGQ